MGTFGFSQVMLFWYLVSSLSYFIVELLKYVFNKSCCIPVRQITVTATQRADELVMRRHGTNALGFSSISFYAAPGERDTLMETLGIAGTNMVEATASLTILITERVTPVICGGRIKLILFRLLTFVLHNTRLHNLIEFTLRKTGQLINMSHYSGNVWLKCPLAQSKSNILVLLESIRLV